MVEWKHRPDKTGDKTGADACQCELCKAKRAGVEYVEFGAILPGSDGHPIGHIHLNVRKEYEARIDMAMVLLLGHLSGERQFIDMNQTTGRVTVYQDGKALPTDISNSEMMEAMKAVDKPNNYDPVRDLLLAAGIVPINDQKRASEQ